MGEIARRIHLSFTSTSRHLVLMEKLDILDRRQEALTAYYSLAADLSPPVRRVLADISNSRE